MSDLNLFDTYLQHWSARAAGEPFFTPSSDLLPVNFTGKLEGLPAMIKISQDLDERIGGQVMEWWDGVGAARVYARASDSGALLIERATGSKHLLRMALEGEDDAATTNICHTLHQLHSNRPSTPPEDLLPLTVFF